MAGRVAVSSARRCGAAFIFVPRIVLASQIVPARKFFDFPRFAT
jgi:hypothetical protein